jgi:hypothetical protein
MIAANPFKSPHWSEVENHRAVISRFVLNTDQSRSAKRHPIFFFSHSPSSHAQSHSRPLSHIQTFEISQNLQG